MSDNSPLRTEQEAAKRARCSVGLLRKLRANGKGPEFYKLGGRLVRYSDDTIAAWLEQSLIKTNNNGGGQ